jgi:hypothetical protein
MAGVGKHKKEDGMMKIYPHRSRARCFTVGLSLVTLLVAGGMANAQMFAVTGTAPAHAATDVPVLNDVSMMCSESLQTPTVTANTFFLYSSKQAAVPATITFPVANHAESNGCADTGHPLPVFRAGRHPGNQP